MATDVQYIVRQDGDRWAVVLQAGKPYGGVDPDGMAMDGFIVEQERVIAHRRTQQAAHDLAARLHTAATQGGRAMPKGMDGEGGDDGRTSGPRNGR